MADVRLIDADALKSEISWYGHHECVDISVSGVMKDIDNAPTIDALPLRCRIGDTVWVVGTKCLSGLYDDECVVDKQIPDCCKNCYLDKAYIVFPRKVDTHLFLYLHDLDENYHFKWGKTVFRTREEAEVALKKMEGGGDDAE